MIFELKMQIGDGDPQVLQEGRNFTQLKARKKELIEMNQNPRVQYWIKPKIESKTSKERVIESGKRGGKIYAKKNERIFTGDEKGFLW
jgi:ribosomal protein L24E